MALAERLRWARGDVAVKLMYVEGVINARCSVAFLIGHLADAPADRVVRQGCACRGVGHVGRGRDAG
eukprot:4921502-Lingulodinium_polyedra.AAC.1